jgi:hypothetical protein
MLKWKLSEGIRAITKLPVRRVSSFYAELAATLKQKFTDC